MMDVYSLYGVFLDVVCFFCFLKQKTEYERRISDWSSDVCSSDLKLTDMLALQMINRRLEARARAGASYLQASVTQEDVSRSVDGTFVSIMPVGEDWEAALNDVRAVIQDAKASPASEAEIDREYREFEALMARSEEHTSELQSLMRSSYAVFCLK